MNEECANDRDTTGMNDTPERQQWFDSAGHLTTGALNESIDGSLSAFDDELLRHHLTVCAECGARREGLARTVALVRSMPEVEPHRSFEIASNPLPGSKPPAKAWFQGVLAPAFPALRVAVAAVFLLLVGVSATDLITQRDDQGDQVAMVADTPAARPESVSLEEAPQAIGAPPAAPAANIEAAESDEAMFAEPSEALGDAAARDDSDTSETGETVDAGADAMDQPGPTPPPEPSPTPDASVARVDAAEESDGLSNWRIVEISLLLLLFWLVVTWIGVERVRKR
ncbi:hypothetical protein BH20CHL4_BH20CHL4_09610 [soil metagenome]